jgi:tryptophan-rich sensory protein
LLSYLAMCFVVAAVGGKITAPAIPGWYADLNKPSWNPPNWIFAPVWSSLYAMMAVAAWNTWNRLGGDWTAPPLRLFMMQLGLNLGWTAIFFGAKRPGLAFAEILVLWAAIAATVVRFWQTSIVAGLLMTPYLAWVSFASALNLAVWHRNR